MDTLKYCCNSWWIQRYLPLIKSRKVYGGRNCERNSIGSYCRDKGVNEIIIFGLICRTSQYHNSRVVKVNDYLQNFVFKIDFILSIIQKAREIFYLESGKVIIANEFIYYLNSISIKNFDGNS